MKIGFENYGKSGDCEIELNDLTIICGPNNSGKTFLSHAIYSVLHSIEHHFEISAAEEIYKELISKGSASIDESLIEAEFYSTIKLLENKVNANINGFFNAPDKFIENSRIKINFEYVNTLKKFEDGFILKIDSGLNLKYNYNPEQQKFEYELSRSPENSEEKNKIESKIRASLKANIIFGNIPYPFPVTSERTGIELFYKDFDYKNSLLFSRLSRNKDIQNLREIIESRPKISIPIEENIDCIRSFETLVGKRSTFAYHENEYKHILDCLSDLLDQGTFHSNHSVITYNPMSGSRDPITPLHLSASSIKALFLIYIFVNHLAQGYHILIIDEPELNLHPDKQILMARLIAKLVNAGVKVLMTTHSDYIIIELNNLISMNHIIDDKKKELMEKFEILEQDLLRPDQINAYVSKFEGGVEKIKVDKQGIAIGLFNDFIKKQNRKSNEIRFYTED